MEAIRVTDKEWQLAGVHYVRTEAMCNGLGVSLEMEFGEDKAGDEYILVMDGIHPVSTCRLHQLDENTGKIERVATLKEYRGQHYGAAAITAAEDWFAERGVKKIFVNSRTEAVAIARALAMEPELLLLDEPTSALDPELVGEVLDTIKKAANEGYTMLLVSHEMNFVKNVATRVIFLENGKIIEDGPPKEVFNHPKSDRVREFFAKINRMVEPEYSI